MALLIPLLILWFRTVHGHYGAAGDQLSLARYHRPLAPRHITVIVPIHHVNRAMIPVLDYARSFGSDIRAVSVDLEPEETTCASSSRPYRITWSDRASSRSGCA